MVDDRQPMGTQPRNNTPERVIARALLQVLSDMKARGEDDPQHLEEANAFAIFMAEHSERLAQDSERRDAASERRRPR